VDVHPNKLRGSSSDPKSELTKTYSVRLPIRTVSAAVLPQVDPKTLQELVSPKN